MTESNSLGNDQEKVACLDRIRWVCFRAPGFDLFLMAFFRFMMSFDIY